MDPLQKKRTDSYQELMVWIQMLLHPLEIGIYTNNYSATAWKLSQLIDKDGLSIAVLESFWMKNSLVLHEHEFKKKWDITFTF